MSSSPPLVVADRYRLVAPLGQGGMGRVWRATDVVLHRDVAIKELVPPPGLTPGERQEMRERSLREARAIARLNNVNVVRVFDVLRTDADPWIVMEYVPSRSLQDTLASDGPFSPVRTAEIGLGVLGALRAAHRAGVVHRDVKPGNVLIGADGRVVLTDFGLATVPGDPNVTRTGLVLGSPAYIAPERARDGTAGPAADLWSLGATLYAAVEGSSPFARPSAIATLAALATENPPPARNAGPLKPVLNGLLRKDPTHRINADEAERLLLRATGRRSKLTFPMSPTMRRPGVGRERPALPGPGTSAAAPVVPGPRPPVVPSRPAEPPGRSSVPGGRAAAGEGRPPVFAPGKATVGRPAAETPTRVDGPKVDAPRLDVTRVDAPPVREGGDKPANLFGTRQAPPTASGQGSGSGTPEQAYGGTSRTARGERGGLSAADVAANRRKKAAPEHEKSLAEAAQRAEVAPAAQQAVADATTVVPPAVTKPRRKPAAGAPAVAEATTMVDAPAVSGAPAPTEAPVAEAAGGPAVAAPEVPARSAAPEDGAADVGKDVSEKEPDEAEPVAETAEAPANVEDEKPATAEAEGEVAGTAGAEDNAAGTVAAEGDAAGAARAEGDAAGSVAAEGDVAGSVAAEGDVAGSVAAEGDVAGSVAAEGKAAGAEGKVAGTAEAGSKVAGAGAEDKVSAPEAAISADGDAEVAPRTVAGETAAAVKQPASVGKKARTRPTKAQPKAQPEPPEPVQVAVPLARTASPAETPATAEAPSPGAPVSGAPVSATTATERQTAAEQADDHTQLTSIGRPTRPPWKPMQVRPPERKAGGVTIFGTRLTYRQAAIGAGVLLVVLLMVVVLAVKAFGGGSATPIATKGTRPAVPTGAATTTTAAAPSSGPSTVPSTQPSSAPSSGPPSSAAPSTGGNVVLPAGWHWYTAPPAGGTPGFTIPIWDGATMSNSDGHGIKFRKGNRLLLVDRTGQPQPDAYQDLVNKEANQSYRGYHKVRLERINYARNAAEWEFSYVTDAGNQQHVIRRNFVVNDNEAYMLSWYVSPDDWGPSQSDWQLIYQGFQAK